MAEHKVFPRGALRCPWSKQRCRRSWEANKDRPVLARCRFFMDSSFGTPFGHAQDGGVSGSDPTRLDAWSRRINTVLVTIPNEGNRATLQRYLSEKRANGAAPGTLLNDVNALRDLCVMLGAKQVDAATKEDIVAYATVTTRERCWRHPRKDGTDALRRKVVALQRSTLAARHQTVRHFFKWLKGGEDYPPEVRFLKTNRKEFDNAPKDALVDASDLRMLLQAHPEPRTKAVLAVLHDSGLRSGELCALNIGSVEFDRFGVVLTLPKGAAGLKTGPRRVRLYESAPYLHAWFEAHPHKDHAEAPLFISMSNRNRSRAARMTPNAVYVLVERVRKLANVKKRIIPRAFRYSAATERARMGWTEGELRAHFGWSRSSDVPTTYIRLTGLDYEEMELERRGLVAQSSANIRALAPRACPSCQAENLATASFCQRCRHPLRPNAEEQMERRRERETHERLLRGRLELFKEALAQRIRAHTRAESPAA